MSKWKQQIDRELGSERKFSKELEQKIIQKAVKKTSKNFAYPLTFVSACLIVLLIIFTWPENTTEQHQANSKPLVLNNLVSNDSVSAFYVSNLFPKDNQFLARSNTLAFGVEKFSSKEDIQVIMQVLKNARLANPSGSSSEYDAVLKFTSGKEKKVKFYDNENAIGILDLETNLFYEVDGEPAEDFLQLIAKNALSLIVLIVLYVISFLLICVNIKEKAPSSMKIFIRFIVLTVLIFIVQGQNIILSIWLPVAVLIVLALQRLFMLSQLDYDIEKLRKVKLYTILLIMIWGIVFIIELIGGVL